MCRRRKASSRPAEELFATKLLRLLLGRHGAPDARVVGHREAEWGEIKHAIRAGAHARRRRGDADGARRVMQMLRGALDRPQVLVMELVPRAAALEGHPRAAALFEPVKERQRQQQQQPQPLSSAGAGGRLRALGHVLAVDVLLNNSDRIVAPCWDNEGNAGNLLLLNDEGDCGRGMRAGLVPIDSVVTSLRTNMPLCAQYVERARAVLASLCADVDADGETGCTKAKATAATLQQVRDFVHNNTGHTLSDAALSLVRAGARQGIVDIAQLCCGAGAASVSTGGSNKLAALRAEVVAAIDVDWQGVWGASAARIDADFLDRMSATFAEVAAEHRANLPPASKRLLLA